MTALMVASTGGHLAQLFELSSRMTGLDDDRLWVTFQSRQGETLLAGRQYVFIPFIAERDVVGVGRGLAWAHRLFRSRRVTAVVSTGSAIALSFLPYAAALRIDTHYVESAARVSRPSLTGRLVARIPGVRLYRQYPQAAGGAWHYGGSVFDGFQPVDAASRPLRRVVVTVGASGTFRRLIEHALAILPTDVEVLWQTGDTPVDDLPIEARPFLATAELDAALQAADVVIAHAGCGSALSALRAGRLPILVPRDPRYGEVVDDHQREIADSLSAQGLALARPAEALRRSDLEQAASRAIVQQLDTPAFGLIGRS